MKEYPYLYQEGMHPPIFKKIAFLAPFEEKYLDLILRSSRIREYSPREIIIREGEKDKGIFILLTGKARVIKEKEELAVLEHTGQIFGELTLLGEESQRSATVSAKTKCLCLFLEADFVENFSPEEKKECYLVLYRVLAGLLGERLRKTSEELAKVKTELEQFRQ